MKQPTTQAPTYVEIPLVQLKLNEGQLEGLPANPREISTEKFELLKQNLQKYPEMLGYRSLLVYPLPKEKYIVIGGNMRLRAMLDLGMHSAPCVIIPQDTGIDKLKAYTILDNNGFGKWEWNMIANEWGTEEVNNWGLDVWDSNNSNIDNFFQEIEKSNETEDSGTTEHITITIPSEYIDTKDEIKKLVKDSLSEYQYIKIV